MCVYSYRYAQFKYLSLIVFLSDFEDNSTPLQQRTFLFNEESFIAKRFIFHYGINIITSPFLHRRQIKLTGVCETTVIVF